MKKMIFILIFTLCACSYVTASKHKQPPKPQRPRSQPQPEPQPEPQPQPDPPSSNWTLRYSYGVELDGAGFTFPYAPGSVNYLTTEYSGPIYQSQSFSMTVQIIGSPTFNYMLEPWNVCVVSASARPYIEAQVPNGCPDAIYSCAPPSARQWSNPLAIELAEGTFSLTVPFLPKYWSDAEGVMGNNDVAGFNATINKPRYIGMTMGGGCFFGHGVNVDGPAQFIIQSVTIQ